MWTGHVDPQSTATCVTQSDVQLYMFERTNGVVRALTPGHFETDRYRLKGTDLSTRDNAISIEAPCETNLQCD